MKRESDYQQITNHLDDAVVIAIESNVVFNPDELGLLLRRLWDERTIEHTQS